MDITQSNGLRNGAHKLSNVVHFTMLKLHSISFWHSKQSSMDCLYLNRNVNNVTHHHTKTAFIFNCHVPILFLKIYDYQTFYKHINTAPNIPLNYIDYRFFLYGNELLLQFTIHNIFIGAENYWPNWKKLRWMFFESK